MLDAAGDPVPGLYAVGTAAVSVFGGGYPGYGANIGPAMIFGHTVGRDIAAHAGERAERVTPGCSPTAAAEPPSRRERRGWLRPARAGSGVREEGQVPVLEGGESMVGKGGPAAPA